jgi:peptidoglycan/LPS O-acetylase OafA/YrhL
MGGSVPCPAGSGDDVPVAGADVAARAEQRVRFDQLDGLRALAMLSVFAYHFGLPLRPILNWGGIGYRIVPNFDLGVEIFFVLSGFLIFRPFAAANLRRAGRPIIRDYAIRRFLRIYPGYWAIFFALLAMHEIQMNGGLLHYGAHLGLVQSYFTDATNDLFDGIQQAWTLVVEVSFYAIVPVLAWLLRRLDVRGHLVVLSGLTLFGYVMRVYTVESPVSGALGRAIGVLPLAMAALAPGMILAVLSLCDVPRLRDAATRTGLWWLVAAACFGVLMATGAGSAAFAVRSATSNAELWHRMLTPVIAVCVVTPCVLAPAVRTGMIRRGLAHPVAVWMGTVSYSAYLWHQALLLDSHQHGDHFRLSVKDMAHKSIPYCLAMGVAILVLVFALSAVTYYLVERPAMRLGRRLSSGGRRAEPAFAPGSPRGGPLLGT